MCAQELLYRDPTNIGNFIGRACHHIRFMFFTLQNGISEKIRLGTFGHLKHVVMDGVIIGLQPGLFSAFTNGCIKVGFVVIFTMAFRKAPFRGTGVMDQKYGRKVGGKKDKSCAHIANTIDLL